MAVSTIVVEDGTEVSGANSYISLADADQIMEDRETAPASTTWSGAADALQNSALIAGCEAMENWYRGRLQGRAVTTTQALLWPRYGVYDADQNNLASDSIPQRLRIAQCLWAYSILAGDRSVNEGKYTPRITAVSAGPVSVTFKGALQAVENAKEILKDYMAFDSTAGVASVRMAYA